MSERKLFSGRSATDSPKERLSKNERLTLIISVSALLLSVLQLIFGSEMVRSFFVQSQVNAVENRYEIKDSTAITTFTVWNNGNANANNVVISFTCLSDDHYTIVPNDLFEVTESQNGAVFKNVLIRSETLIPDEQIFIYIASDGEDYVRINDQLFAQRNDSTAPSLPALNYVKLEDSFVKISR